MRREASPLDTDAARQSRNQKERGCVRRTSRSAFRMARRFRFDLTRYYKRSALRLTEPRSAKFAPSATVLAETDIEPLPKT